MLFIPDWPLQWVRTLLSAPDPLAGYSTWRVFAAWWPGVGERLGWVLTGILGLVLLIEWWLASRKYEFTSFFWAACLTLAAGPLLGIPTSPANYILLFMPLVFIWAVWLERMERGGLFVTLLTMALLFALPWVIYMNISVPAGSSLPLAGLLIPLPLFLMFGLYWIRWWATRPQRLFVQVLRDHEAF
jgi:hypothetical protein